MQPAADNPEQVIDCEHNRGQGLTPEVTSFYFSLGDPCTLN